MKTFRSIFYGITITLLLCVHHLNAQSKWVSFHDNSKEGSKPEINIINSKNDEITIAIQMDGMESYDKHIDNEIYQKITILNGGRTCEVGEPELPTVGRFFEIPFGANPTITIENSRYKEIDGFNIYPSQEPLPDIIGYDQLFKFEKNNKVYSTDNYYPEQISIIDKPQMLRGHRIVLVNFYPVQYNPVSKKLRLYSEITVKISFSDIVVKNDIKDDYFFQPLLDKLILNYESDYTKTMNKQSNSLNFNSGGADYLIITPDEFYDDILPLAEWKHRKGLKVRIATESDITSAGYTWTADNTFNSTFTGIDGYIKYAYDNWSPAPSFVLLVGDADELPTHYINDHPDWRVEGNKKVGTDLYYGTMDDSNDLSYVPFPDIFIGRIPVKSSSDIDAITTKIFNFELNPYMQTTSWFNTVLLASYDDNYYIATSEAVRTFLEGEGYTCNRVYCGGSYTGTTQNVVDNINSGCFLINHRDHGDSKNGPYGSSEGWTHPSFVTSDISSLTNRNFPSVMFSVNCRSGWFDGETDKDNTDPSPIPDCLGEAWLKTSGKGGSGFIGATRASYSGYNDELMKGYYDAIWDNFNSGYSAGYDINSSYKYALGHVSNYGKFWMYDKYVLTGGGSYSGCALGNVYTRTQFEEFHVLGDPAMTIWTDTPSQFSNITVSDNGTSISVNTNGVNDCDICISSGVSGGIHSVGQNTSNHSLTTSTRPLYITVTKHNYIPYTIVTGGTFTSDETWFGKMKVIGNITIATGVFSNLEMQQVPEKNAAVN